jgi:Phage ABA sandwich domain
MNLREIDRLVATKVMGWKILEIKHTDSGVIGGFYDDGEKLIGVGEWSPTSDIRVAWQVVEKLRDRYVYMNLTNNDDSYCCELMEQDLENSSRYFTYYADAETAPLAICLAALKAVGVNIK